jgi:hypothetical protein
MAFVMSDARFRCMCGNIHKVPLDRAEDGLGVAHWRCTDCRRRFVLTFSPPEVWTPIYLDSAVRSIDVRETGPSEGSNARNPVPPPAIPFACPCGESMTAHSWMYGGTTVCPGCHTTLFLVLKYSTKKRSHVIVPESPHRSSPV